MTEDMNKDMETIAALDEILSSSDMPEGCMQLSELDGFLTGIAVGPDNTSVDDWLPWIIGDSIENADHAAKIKPLLADHFEQISNDLTKGYSIDPLLWEDDDGNIEAGEWADGFMTAVDMHPESWLKILEDDDARMHMVPLLALACDEEGAPLLVLTEQDLAKIIDNIEAVLAKSVESIRDYWAQ